MATLIKGNEDYIYCEDCNMFVDLWKYGHENCKWRYVTDKELAECIEDCEQAGCFREV